MQFECDIARLRAHGRRDQTGFALATRVPAPKFADCDSGSAAPYVSRISALPSGDDESSLHCRGRVSERDAHEGRQALITPHSGAENSEGDSPTNKFSGRRRRSAATPCWAALVDAPALRAPRGSGFLVRMRCK